MKIVIYLVVVMLLAACHKSEDKPMRHVVYETSGTSNDCYIEYNDYANKRAIILEHVSANFRLEFDIPASDIVQSKALMILIQTDTPRTHVDAYVYINDSVQNATYAPGYCAATNK